MITTTLNKIRSCGPCENGWKKLLKHLGKTEADDDPLPFQVILASNGLEDALWCCRSAPEHDKEWRLFAVWCARQVQHRMTDPRSPAALDVAERFANGDATEEERSAAAAAAWSAARSAAATAAAWSAARSAAATAARDAAGAAWAAAAAWDAARSAAARSAARSAAAGAEFLRIVK